MKKFGSGINLCIADDPAHQFQKLPSDLRQKSILPLFMYLQTYSFELWRCVLHMSR